MNCFCASFLECRFHPKPSCIVCLLTRFNFALDISSEISSNDSVDYPDSVMPCLSRKNSSESGLH